MGAGRAGDRVERAERAKRWAERWAAERAGYMVKASMSLKRDMEVVLKKSLADKRLESGHWQGEVNNLRLRASELKPVWLMCGSR